jgi:hypothetical protein
MDNFFDDDRRHQEAEAEADSDPIEHFYTQLEANVLLVDPIDAVESMLWLAPSKVIIFEGDNPMYPCKIFNEDQNRAVNAKLASK